MLYQSGIREEEDVGAQENSLLVYKERSKKREIFFCSQGILFGGWSEKVAKLGPERMPGAPGVKKCKFLCGQMQPSMRAAEATGGTAPRI